MLQITKRYLPDRDVIELEYDDKPSGTLMFKRLDAYALAFPPTGRKTEAYVIHEFRKAPWLFSMGRYTTCGPNWGFRFGNAA